MKQVIKYQADDGTLFDNEEQCRLYETLALQFHTYATAKLGHYIPEELVIGDGVMRVVSVPCDAPWMSPSGAYLLKILDIRRNPQTRAVEFQLGDKDAKPYLIDNTPVWVDADAFWNEWPQ
jgi:hypothetical protein